ncbi:MAG: hypothetical protein UGE23_00895 [Peptococcaceae bacterium]|nr:hypothetical protein [Peptococcaceae bacterium]
MAVNPFSKRRSELLRDRSKHCVCKFCGGKLRLNRIIFSDLDEAQVELFCTSCDKIEFGVDPNIREAAKIFYDKSGFNCYPDLELNETTINMNIAKISEIIDWGLKCLSEKNHTIFINDLITLTDEDILVLTQNSQ